MPVLNGFSKWSRKYDPQPDNRKAEESRKGFGSVYQDDTLGHRRRANMEDLDGVLDEALDWDELCTEVGMYDDPADDPNEQLYDGPQPSRSNPSGQSEGPVRTDTFGQRTFTLDSALARQVLRELSEFNRELGGETDDSQPRPRPTSRPEGSTYRSYDVSEWSLRTTSDPEEG